MSDDLYIDGIKLEFDPPRPPQSPAEYRATCDYIAQKLRELRESRETLE